MKFKPLNRDSLKAMFKSGSRPSEGNFSSLIESMVNKVDDGISKNLKDGLILAPEGEESDRLISLYANLQNSNPNWSFEMDPKNQNGLKIHSPLNQEGRTSLFLNEKGSVGVNTETPQADLDVNGVIAAKARIGTHKISTVPADGKWRDILTGLDGCKGFEIMAQVGKKKKGRYALVKATALSTFGNSNSHIHCVQAHYGWWWNKIAFRFKGDTHNYSLQIKTRSNYGPDEHIKYFITRLWDDEMVALFDQ